MSEIKDRQDAASDIDPIVAALADDMANDSWAAAAVEGISEAAEPVGAAAELAASHEPAATEAAKAASDIEPAGGQALTAAVTVDAADLVSEEPPIAFTAEGDNAAVAADDDLGDEAAPVAPPAGAEAMSEAMSAEAPPAADWADAALTETVAGATDAPPLARVAAAHADTVVELEDQAYGSDGDDEDDGPLLDGDLEHGIASVFAALHAAAQDAPVEPLGDLEAAEGVTFRLLGELDCLWHRAA